MGYSEKAAKTRRRQQRQGEYAPVWRWIESLRPKTTPTGVIYADPVGRAALESGSGVKQAFERGHILLSRTLRRIVFRLMRKQGGVRLITGVYLWGDALCSDLPRFVRVFRGTWLQLPWDVRRALRGYWLDTSAHPSSLYAPDIWFVDGKAARNQRERIADLMGVTSRNGCTIQFAAEYVNSTPDALLTVLIAHELCHAYRSRKGGERCADKAEEESSARRMNKGWGFDEDALDRWSPDFV